MINFYCISSGAAHHVQSIIHRKKIHSSYIQNSTLTATKRTTKRPRMSINDEGPSVEVSLHALHDIVVYIHYTTITIDH